MGTSEKGRADVSPTDFPPDKTREVAKELGERAQGEPVKEVPNA